MQLAATIAVVAAVLVPVLQIRRWRRRHGSPICCLEADATTDAAAGRGRLSRLRRTIPATCSTRGNDASSGCRTRSAACLHRIFGRHDVCEGLVPPTGLRSVALCHLPQQRRRQGPFIMERSLRPEERSLARPVLLDPKQRPRRSESWGDEDAVRADPTRSAYLAEPHRLWAAARLRLLANYPEGRSDDAGSSLGSHQSAPHAKGLAGAELARGRAVRELRVPHRPRTKARYGTKVWSFPPRPDEDPAAVPW